MKRNIKRRAVSLTLLLAMTCSCVSGALTKAPDIQAAKKASIKDKKITLEVGAKKTIKITGKQKKASYLFKASNKKIKVSKKGVITGVKAGSAKVTVKEKYQKKTKKIGVVSVQVKAKQTPAAPSDTPAATGTPTATQPAGTSTPSAGTPTPTPENPTSPAPTASATVAPTATPTAAPTKTPESTFTPTDEMYTGMKDKAVRSTGNNARIKNVISRAKAGEEITLAYIGGSITEGALAEPNDKCYASVSAKAFGETYGTDGGSNVHCINAGVSGTPSALGIVRYDNDILGKMDEGKTPDILFIEFAVNDYGECTDGGAYEGLIRRGLASGSAVILIFSTFQKNAGGRVMESSYIPIGTYYDLPMISMGDGIEKYFSPSFYKWYFGDTLHPNNTGHQLMADVIMNLIDKMDKEDAEPDNIDSSNLPEPTNTDAFTNTKCIDAHTDISTLSAVTAFDKGDFTDTDTETPVSQVDGNNFFPNNWMHSASSGNTGITATINCKNLLIVYKQSPNRNTAGTADILVDGKKVKSLDGYKAGGWNNAETELVFNEAEAKEHKIEIRMAKDSENKNFTVIALGYNE